MKRSFWVLFVIVASLAVIDARAADPLKKIAVRIPTRAGDSLNADAWISDESSKKPVILVQTPYNKNYQDLRTGNPDQVKKIFFDTANYHYVLMDWRGLYSNASVAKSGYDRGLDGYDAIEWIAKQGWCDGKIGTYGSSALGLIQFQTMVYNPPHLICAAPFVIDYENQYQDFYCGGSYREEYVNTIASLGFTTQSLVLSHPKFDLFWKLAAAQTDISDKVNVPLLMMTGWYDHFPSEVIRAFTDIKEKSAESVRSKHKLIIGPWEHTGIGDLKQGELSFPEAVELPNDAIRQFFGRFLLNEKNNWEGVPNIRYFQMGENSWKQLEEWASSPEEKSDTLFAAYPNGLVGNKWEIPDFADQKSTYVFDPRNPSPTVGGSRFSLNSAQNPAGPMDISKKVESRNDCVLLTTQPFTKNYSIRGKAIVKLSIESDRTDTDFGVRLTDVYPDGKSMILTQGMLRARFRKSLETETPLTPGAPDSVEIELPDVAHTFLPGHALRIVVSSSNYPMFSINPNDGGELYKKTDTVSAVNSIRYGKGEPTYIILKGTKESSIGENAPAVFKIFPNPARNFVTLSGFQYPQFEIYDIFGNKLRVEYQIGVYSNRIDLTGLTSGIYFIRAGGAAQKLIKL